jgi:hypothetical protein
MIVTGSSLHCVGLKGELRIEASRSVPLEAVFLGAGFRPSWNELKRFGPLHFQANLDEPVESLTPREVARDFGDSSVCCVSGSGATATILSDNKPSNQRQIPAAMSFAFTQQWARYGYACVHGALLSFEGKGVLVLGTRAAGKSVLSASALAGGGAIVTDDYLLVGALDNRILGERIRRFISLRRSWAADILVNELAGEWSPDRSKMRLFMRVESDDDRFPVSSQIDQIWILNRPRAERREHSSLNRLNHAELYAALVSAIQPLLLGNNFPHERDKLQCLLIQLIKTVPAARLETGQDIVMDSKRTWARLLACSP